MTAATKLRPIPKQRPMLFSAPMVRALLAGTKSQTRRVVNPQPTRSVLSDSVWAWKDGLFALEKYPTSSLLLGHCPHGQPGDQLWVRETWKPTHSRFKQDCSYVRYRADDARVEVVHSLKGKASDAWRSPIHMPRWASRITLEITEVRVQRLNDISEEDALAEGVEENLEDGVAYYGPLGAGHIDPRVAYSGLWESIHGHDSWDLNPWVWCISFRRAPP